MSNTATESYEVRWRKTTDANTQWSTPVKVRAGGHLSVPEFERITDYTFEARAISYCGAKSNWITQTFNIPDVTAPNPVTSLTAQTVADGVHLSWSYDFDVQDPGIEFHVERSSTANGTFTTRVKTGSTAWTDPETSGSTYYYRVKAVDWRGNSGSYSSVVSSSGVSVSAISNTANTALSVANTAQSTANTATALASQVAVINAGFDAGDTGWQKGTGWSIKSDGSFGHGQGYAERVGGADGALRNNAVCFVQPGHSYKVQALIKAIGANGQCYARISWRDLNDAEIGTTNGNLITGTTVAGSFAVGTPPVGAVFAHAEIAATSHTVGTYQVDNVVSTLQPATADEIAESTSRKWAGESGADITGSHIAADTTKVSGVAAADVITPGQNLLVNASGQLGMAGWSVTGNCTLSIVSHSWGNTFHLTRTGAGTIYAYQTVTGIVIGAGFSVAAQAKAWIAGGTGTIHLDAEFSDGTNTADATNTTTAKNLLVSTGGPSATSTYARFRVFTTDETLTDIEFILPKLEQGNATPHNDVGTGVYGAAVRIPNMGKAFVDFGDNTAGGHLGKHLGNIADDVTSTRYAVASIDGNRRALIDATQAGHIGAWDLDSRVADGTNFRRVGAGYTDSNGRIVNLWDGTAIRDVPTVWDGAKRARTGLNSAGNLIGRLATARKIAGVNFDGSSDIDVPLSGLTGRTADNIAETSTLKWAGESGADKTLSHAPADNLVANPGFELNVTDGVPHGVLIPNTQSGPAAGWTWLSYNTSTFTAYLYSGSSRTGYGVGLLFRATGIIPADNTYHQMRALSSPMPVSKGDVISYRAWRAVVPKSSIPSGISFISRVSIYFLDGDGNTLAGGEFYNDTTSTTGFVQTDWKTATAPDDAMYVSFQCAALVKNTSGSDIALDSSNYINFSFDDVEMVRNDIRVAGSGQTIGDQRNLLPVTWAGVRSVLSSSPISYSISGTTVNVSVAAVTFQGGGPTASFNASSGSVTQTAGTTVNYWCYYRDAGPNYGGSKTLYITSNVQDLAAYPDIWLLGSFSATVASGGGGTGGTGGGGGGLCVADDMFIGEGRRAGDTEIGDLFDCIDLPTSAGKHVRALQGVTRGIEECVRMITSDGCALVCSVSTPFDLPDGRNTTATHMLGEQVITDLGTATVISLALVGPRPVTRAHLGGVSYAAGADPMRRIYSHNAGTEKP